MTLYFDLDYKFIIIFLFSEAILNARKPNQSSQLNDYLSRLNKLTLNSLYYNIIKEDIERDDGDVSFLK